MNIYLTIIIINGFNGTCVLNVYVQIYLFIIGSNYNVKMTA